MSSITKPTRKFAYLGGQYRPAIGVSTRDGNARATSEFAYKFPGNGMRDEARMLNALAAERDADGDGERVECSA